jgi:hypothetical protein
MRYGGSATVAPRTDDETRGGFLDGPGQRWEAAYDRVGPVGTGLGSKFTLHPRRGKNASEPIILILELRTRGGDEARAGGDFSPVGSKPAAAENLWLPSRRLLIREPRDSRNQDGNWARICSRPANPRVGRGCRNVPLRHKIHCRLAHGRCALGDAPGDSALRFV